MADIQHLVNVSGGKDSTATYLKAIESGRPFRAVFADTGNEHELTYEYVSKLAQRTGGPDPQVVKADFKRQLAQHRRFVLDHWPRLLIEGKRGEWRWMPKVKGVEADCASPSYPNDPYLATMPSLVSPAGRWKWQRGYRPIDAAQADEIAQTAAALHEPSGNPFLDLCVMKGRFPSRRAQFCTEELKTMPITEQVVLPMLRQGKVLQWLGIRAAESPERADHPLYNRHESGAMLWRPIFDWTEKDVWAMHRRHALLPNPLYALGSTRVGCYPCVNCRKDELRSIADRFPLHIDRIAEWERIVALTNKHHSATFFPAVTDPTDVDRPGTYSGIRTLVEWSRTGRGGRQFDIFMQQQSGGGCTSDLGLCERSAA